MPVEEEKKDEKGMGYYFGLGEVLTYFFRKKDPNRKSNFNIRAMHTINKISIIVFLLGMLFFIFKIFVLR